MYNMFKKRFQPNGQYVAVEHCRSLSDDDWRRFKRAVEWYHKADIILSGEDVDSDIGDISEQIIET